MRVTDKYVLFWESEFSNFYPYEHKGIKTEDVEPLNFEADGYEWKTSEQYFMYQKAMFFHDFEIADKIKATVRPEEAKKLGRKIKNFNEEEWSKVSFDMMFNAVYAKFSQNERLKNILLDNKFKDKNFVEASPFDKIWGIGLHYDDKLCDDETNWLGENKLGKVLDKVRNTLLEKEKLEELRVKIREGQEKINVFIKELANEYGMHETFLRCGWNREKMPTDLNLSVIENVTLMNKKHDN